MTEFHTEAAKRNWTDTQSTQSKNVLRELAAIIRDHVLVGFAVGLDAKYYRSLPNHMKEGINKPNVACLQRILRLIRNRLAKEQYEQRITFTLDEEQGTVVALYKDITALRRSRRDLGRFIGAVCFADDEFMVPLQAADMLANLTYRWYRDRTEGKCADEEPPEPLRSLLIDPCTGRSLDYRHELWSDKALDAGISQLLEGAKVEADGPPCQSEEERT